MLQFSHLYEFPDDENEYEDGSKKIVITSISSCKLLFYNTHVCPLYTYMLAYDEIEEKFHNTMKRRKRETRWK
jgi:hypothetical protein